MHPGPPHRWDLLSPDQLGTLVDPGAPGRTPCLAELVEAAARAVPPHPTSSGSRCR